MPRTGNTKENDMNYDTNASVPFTVDVDLTNVPAHGDIKLGRNRVQVIGIQAGIAKSSGNQQYIVSFSLNGYKINDYFPLTSTALWKLQSFLKAMGAPCTGHLRFTSTELIGKVLDVEIGERPYTKKDGSQGTGYEIKKYLDLPQDKGYTPPVEAVRTPVPQAAINETPVIKQPQGIKPVPKGVDPLKGVADDFGPVPF